MQWVEAHAERLNRFRHRIVWVAPIRLDGIEDILEWNKGSELISIALVDVEDRWPAEMGFQSTPVFYFLNDGRVVDRIIGWQHETSAAELMTKINRWFDATASSIVPPQAPNGADQAQGGGMRASRTE